MAIKYDSTNLEGLGLLVVSKSELEAELMSAERLGFDVSSLNVLTYGEKEVIIDYSGARVNTSNVVPLDRHEKKFDVPFIGKDGREYWTSEDLRQSEDDWKKQNFTTHPQLK